MMEHQTYDGAANDEQPPHAAVCKKVNGQAYYFSVAIETKIWEFNLVL